MMTINDIIQLYYFYEFLSYDDILSMKNLSKSINKFITNDQIIKNIIKPYIPKLFRHNKDSIEFIRGTPSHCNIDIENYLKKNLNKYNDDNQYSIYIYIDYASSWCNDSKSRRCTFARGLYSRCDHINSWNPKCIFSVDLKKNNIIKLKNIYNKLIENYDNINKLNYI